MPLLCIALGSNIEPQRNLPLAAEMLRDQWPEIRFSPVYRSRAVGYEKQPAFLNAVACVESRDDPAITQTLLRDIEKALGKDVTFRWGPRTIDLDLLLWGDAIIPDAAAWKKTEAIDEPSASLLVPHPRMHRRGFVLQPLIDLIDPTDTHPVLKRSWKDLAEDAKEQAMERVDLKL
jgi:2-amino-4-hydroxy-6-hydroxymethyldihydropteridine diphosphokinase